MIKLNGNEVKFETFPNGETRLITDGLVVSGKIEKLLFKYENDSDLIKLMFLKKYMDSMHVGDKVSLFITYMPYSRMDRSESYSPFTLKYVGEFIDSLNFKQVVAIEPHSDVTCAVMKNATAKYVNYDLLPKVMEEVGFLKEIDYIYFPDTGASKRYHNLKGFKQLVGHKDRDFQTGEIKSLKVVGDVVNPDIAQVIIVDDLSSYGGTFVHSAKALRDLGFESAIHLLVAHAENSIFKGKLFDHVNRVFTTDSLLTEQDNWENQKFASQLKVYEVEGLL